MISFLPASAFAVGDLVAKDPMGFATALLDRHHSFGAIDMAGLRSDLADLAGQDAGLADSVRAEIAPRLSLMEQVELEAGAGAMGPEVVVTGRSGGAAERAVDPALIERPTTVREFNTLSELRAARENFRQEQERTGRKSGDEYIEAGFDKAEAKLEARTAFADRAALDVMKSVVPPLDTMTAAWRVAANGEYTLDNGLTLGGAALGGVLGVAGRGVGAVGDAAIGVDRTREALPLAFDGELATKQLLGTATTPDGRQIMFHAADRMVNPPAGRLPMSPAEVDQVLNGATSIVKRQYHPMGGTLTIENANMAGRPRVIVDEASGQRIITVINPRGK